jgi:hypothetical protein
MQFSIKLHFRLIALDVKDTHNTNRILRKSLTMKIKLHALSSTPLSIPQCLVCVRCAHCLICCERITRPNKPIDEKPQNEEICVLVDFIVFE